MDSSLTIQYEHKLDNFVGLDLREIYESLTWMVIVGKIYNWVISSSQS